MMDLPPLFSAKGVFEDLASPVLDSLPDDARATYERVRGDAANLKLADAAAAEAAERVSTCAAAVVEMENCVRKNYPRRTFHDLWNENYQRTT